MSPWATAVLASDFPSLHVRATAAVADLEAILVQSRTLSVRLCQTAPRICGGSDVDSPLVVEIISKASMCLPCVAGKTGISEVRALETIERIRAFRPVETARSPCAGCLRVSMTYRIPDRAAAAPHAPPARQSLTTLNGALWRFLEDHRGKMFCTQCMATALSATRRIDRAVLGAEGRGARRHYGACASCGRERLLCGLAS